MTPTFPIPPTGSRRAEQPPRQVRRERRATRPTEAADEWLRRQIGGRRRGRAVACDDETDRRASAGSRKGFGLTFATMFKKVYTQQYPFDFYPTAPRYHGRHVLNRHPDGLEKCVGCELCAWACPADAIYVEGGDNTDDRALFAG